VIAATRQRAIPRCFNASFGWVSSCRSDWFRGCPIPGFLAPATPRPACDARSGVAGVAASRCCPSPLQPRSRWARCSQLSFAHYFGLSTAAQCRPAAALRGGRAGELRPAPELGTFARSHVRRGPQFDALLASGRSPARAAGACLHVRLRLVRLPGARFAALARSAWPRSACRPLRALAGVGAVRGHRAHAFPRRLRVQIRLSSP